ncbi:MAG TPA: hypothetical protein VN948_22785 [Terriglobales bacterium]|nr:hypothetical protein [Terriglobales bacterium]
MRHLLEEGADFFNTIAFGPATTGAAHALRFGKIPPAYDLG